MEFKVVSVKFSQDMTLGYKVYLTAFNKVGGKLMSDVRKDHTYVLVNFENMEQVEQFIRDVKCSVQINPTNTMYIVDDYM